MDLKQLRYFVAAAETGNIGVAAKKLHVSQPPVTRQIHKLEREVGGDLFVRTARGVELTDAGRTLLSEARELLAHADLAVQRTRSAHLGEIGSLDVGFMGSPIYSTVPDILQDFRARLPKVSISLYRLGKQAQIDALRAGRLHVGFARFFPTEPDLSSIQVALEAPMLAMAGESGTESTPIRLADMRDAPLILFPRAGRPNFADSVMQICKQQRVKPRIGYTAEDLTSALALTAAGVGYCLVPATVAQLRWPNVRFCVVRGVKATIPVNCIYRSDRRSPVLLAFLDSLREFSQPD